MPSSPRDVAYAALRRAYTQFLGREAGDDEIESHLGGDYSSAAVDRAVGFVMRSPEAEAYRQRQTTPPPTTPPPTTPPPGAPPPNPTTDPFENRPASGDFGRVSGADPRNWGTMQSVKYRVLELAARYPPNPSGLDQLMNDPDFKKLFPNARIIDRKSGVIDVGGTLSDFSRGVPVTRVDIGEAFDEGNNSGKSWYWNDLVNTGEQTTASTGADDAWKYKPPAPTTPPAPPAPTPPPPPGGGGDPGNPNQPPAPEPQNLTLAGMNQQPQQAQQPVPWDPQMLKLSELAKARGQRVGVPY